MKDKLTKNHLTKFDRLCNKLRNFGFCLIAITTVSFLPLNHKIEQENHIMSVEINALKNENEEDTELVITRRFPFKGHHIIIRFPNFRQPR